MAEKPDWFGATARGSDGKPEDPISNTDRLEPVGPNGQVGLAASPETRGGRPDSGPEEKPSQQEAEQDTSTCQQLESRDDGSTAAAGEAAVPSWSPGAAQRQGSCDGEEKQDQSKEEPPLELKQQEG